MTATFPGVDPPKAPTSWTWADAATIIEMKLKEDKVPVDGNIGLKGGEEHGRVLAQLAVNVCNMFKMKHRSWFVFIVGIYGTNARLFRFDRIGVIASQLFSGDTGHVLLAPLQPETSPRSHCWE